MEQRNESGEASSVRRIRWYQSLTFQLGLTWTVITLLSILVLGVALIGIAQRTQQENILRQQEKSAGQVALLISSYINGVANELSLFEGTQSLMALTSDEQKAALEQLLIRRRTVFSQIVLLAKSGRETVKVSTTRTYAPGDLVSQADSEAFLAAVSGETYISPIFVSPESGLLSVQVAIPVKATGSQIAGVLVAEANVARLWQDVARIEIGETGYAYLVDAEGRFLAYQEPSAVLQRYGEDMKQIPPVSDFVAGAQQEQTLLEYAGLNGQEVVGFFTPVTGTGWATIVELPTREAFASVRQMQIYLIGLTMLGLVITVGLGFVLLNRTLRPILQLTDVAREVGQGNLTIEAPVRTKDEVGVLATVFNSMTIQLRQTLDGLEQKVVERTRALQTSTEVSRRLSTILDQKQLVTEVVEQVKNAFNYYHAHIYIIDEAKGDLVMAGGTGEAGQTMLARGHKIPKGRGLVGRAAETNVPVLVADTSQDPDWLPNPLLPETKSEAAIPISVGEQVLGVLDVQHNVVAGLKQEDAELLQSIANQVAVAMRNISQYETTQKIASDMGVVANVGIATSTITDAATLLQEVVDLTRKSFNLYHAHIYLLNEAGDTLQLFAGAGEVGRRMVSEGRSIPLDSEKSLVARAARDRAGVVVNDVALDPGFLPHPLLPETHAEMAVPMLVAGKPIGVLDVQSELVGRFTEIDVSIQTTLASQVAIAVQNARSFAQAQKQAERETRLNLISQKIQGATTIESAMQIAARELGHALGKKSTMVTLNPGTASGEKHAKVKEATGGAQ